MADPVSVAASITGLVMAGTQIATTVGKFVSTAIGAPALAQIVHTEVHDFVIVLSSLQPIILGSVNLISRTSLIDVDELIITLSSCMCTLADLEKEVDSLASDTMDVRTRLKWAWAESTLSGLTQRLQNHKASLNLMLTILTCETQAQANQSVQALQALVQQISQQLNQIYLNSPSMQNTPASGHTNALNSSGVSIRSSASTIASSSASTSSGASTIRGNYASSILTIQSSRGSLERGVGSVRSIHSMSSYHYESTLLNTRVYAQALAKPWHAASEAAGWSVMSGRSLAEVSNISVLELPFHAASLSNPWWYDGSICTESVQVKAETVQVIAENVQVRAENAQVEAENVQVEAENVQVEAENVQAEAENVRPAPTMRRYERIHGTNLWTFDFSSKWWPYALYTDELCRDGGFKPRGHVQPINDIIQELDSLPITEFGKPPPIPIDDVCWLRPRRWMLEEQSDFIQAVRKGDTRMVQHYLYVGHDINSVIQGWPAIIFAVINDDIDMVELLLRHGADTEREGPNGNTPLQLASRRGKDKIISVLLDYDADITRCCSKRSINPHRGQSIWHAAQEGHSAAVATLLKYSGASTLLKLCEICQRSPVGECITESDFEIVCVIGLSFANNGGPEEIRSKLITAAIYREQFVLARRLVMCSLLDGSPLPKDSFMFHSAVRSGDVELVQAFCSAGAGEQDMLDEDGQTPLEAAAKLGLWAVTQCLLENDFDPEVSDAAGVSDAAERRRFMVAMGNEDDYFAVELLNQHAHQLVQDKSDCDTYLRQAISKGLDQSAMRLIELGAPIDRRDEMGLTALHVAAASGDPYLVRLLLTYGWNRNAKDNSGRTALIHAIRAGSHEASMALCAPMEHTDRSE